MVVCLCKGVADGAIRRAIRAGARTVPDIGRACGAGTGCGSCQNLLACALRHEDLRRARPDVPAVLAAAYAPLQPAGAAPGAMSGVMPGAMPGAMQ